MPPSTATAPLPPLREGPESWGRYPRAHHRLVPVRDRGAPLPAGGGPMLPYGNGRSYGDSCLNDGGTLLHTRALDRILAFDAEAGTVTCEAGVLLAEVLARVVPAGWFLPVVPGTQLVTVGGAIANDIHGKNHHVAGTFGAHVRAFELLRSDGQLRLCTPTSHPELFRATIGGLGLTGVVTWAELQLVRTPTPWLHQEVVRYGRLAEFFALSAESDRDWPATVSWVDCTGTGRTLGRGVFMRGTPAGAEVTAGPAPRRWTVSVPVSPPLSLVNPLTLRLFNQAYWHRAPAHPRRSLVHYAPFYFPLDAIGRWNRAYGPRGFLQWQGVVPMADAPAVIEALLGRIAAEGQGSFLAVLKCFGDRPSPGVLSFPRPGVTLALDFPNTGARLFALLDALDAEVLGVGGALYPAKDARMTSESFRRSFPQWPALAALVDPAFSSSFWRRVTA